MASKFSTLRAEKATFRASGKQPKQDGRLKKEMDRRGEEQGKEEKE